MKMIVIVGESAAGKSTVQNEICKEPVFEKVITYTTRPPRENEKDGVDYHFISKEEFEKRIGENFFVEYTQYRGWYYGTAEKDCKPNTVAVLNPQGMRSLKARGFEFVSFYIKVDRRSRLVKILQRGDEIEEAYRRNLTDVGQFIGVENEVDYVVINDNYNLSPIFIAELIIVLSIGTIFILILENTSGIFFQFVILPSPRPINIFSATVRLGQSVIS